MTGWAVAGIIVSVVIGAIGVGVTIIMSNRSIRKENREAHDRIGQNIAQLAGRLDRIDRRDRRQAAVILEEQ